MTFAEEFQRKFPKIQVIEAGDVIRLDPGNAVYCDDCYEDWSDRPESGGLYGFGTKAMCPNCAPKWEQLAKQYNEEYAIRARCPPDKSFADWVRTELR